MYHFKDILVGDLFNTKVARFVKISETEAICVMSPIVPIGAIRPFIPEYSVVVLWSCTLSLDKE